MPRYVAFLRAINVGGRVVRMERLRGIFAELGLANVETFIASGNVIFTAKSKNAAALEQKIERRLNDALGFDVKVFLRRDDELAEIAARRAFAARETEAEGASVYVAFLGAEPTPAATEILSDHRGSVDAFAMQGREIFWLCRTRFSDSEFSGSKLEKLLGMRTTVRNLTTIKKLAAKYPSALSR